MRKVLISKFIKTERSIEGGMRKIDHIYSDFIHEALFHCWGLDIDEGASFTVAIVEWPDGQCEFISVSKIKFI